MIIIHKRANIIIKGTTMMTISQFSMHWHTLLHSDVNPTDPLLWIFCLIHIIVTET